MKIITKLLFIIQISLFFGLSHANGQNNIIDNYGTEFYFAFMPNFHNDGIDADQLIIFITSQSPTQGVLNYRNRFGNPQVEPFTIDEPNGIAKIYINAGTGELTGQNNSGRQRMDGGDTETISQKTFHITSDDDISVVIHSEAEFSSDACLVYPVDALGRNYFVFSYESNFYSNMNYFGTTPSQFCVVGTEDSTTVEITPTASTFRNGTDKQTIVLNQGEVYLVQADIIRGTTSSGNSDLTGTRILSDKPVAVFGGQQRANIPFNRYGSRDFLLSQMIPLEAWGRDVFVVPFADPEVIQSNESDLNRITVAYDNTTLFVGGEEYATMNQGDVITRDISEPFYIEGDKPIRASLYKRSTRTGGGQFSASDSDPFMVLFPPKQQFLREYNFVNVDLPNYDKHYVSVIIPTEDINSLRIDNNPVVADFQPVFGIDYSYANILVSPGGHNIKADTTFGICIYGYGQTDSYGYVGGLGLEVTDWTPPSYSLLSNDCEVASFSFSEELDQDTGLDSIVIVENQNINIEELENSATNYSANLSLIDKYNDGLLEFYAKDVDGSKTSEAIIIEGFTLTISQSDRYEFTNLKTDTVKPFRNYCQNVTITNYGITDKSIANLKLVNEDIFSMTQVPNTLAAGASYTFQVCYESELDFGLSSDTLRIVNDCFEEDLGVVSFFLPEDKSPPELTQTRLECGDGTLLASESFDTQYGFGKYEQIESNNVEITEIRNDLDNIELGLELIDPYKDGTYTIMFEDLVGNDTIYSGILQGFTADFVNNTQGEAIILPATSIGNSACQSVMIQNTGLLPISLDQIDLRDKFNFFIPQSQLPLVIPPDTALPLVICFYDDEPTDINVSDLIEMTFNCLEKDIVIQGKTEEVITYSNSRCDYEYRIRFDNVPFIFSVEAAYPNPTDEQVNMVVSVDQPRNTTIDLINTQGERFRYLSEVLQKGDYNINLDVSEMPSGNYIIEIISEENRVTQKLLINK